MFVLLLILLFKAYINISDIFSYSVFIKEIIKNNFMGKECISIYIYISTYLLTCKVIRLSISINQRQQVIRELNKSIFTKQVMVLCSYY